MINKAFVGAVTECNQQLGGNRLSGAPALCWLSDPQTDEHTHTPINQENIIVSRSKKRPIPLKCDMEKKYKNENCHLCLVSLSSLIVVLMHQIFSLNVILMFISKH